MSLGKRERTISCNGCSHSHLVTWYHPFNVYCSLRFRRWLPSSEENPEGGEGRRWSRPWGDKVCHWCNVFIILTLFFFLMWRRLCAWNLNIFLMGSFIVSLWIVSAYSSNLNRKKDRQYLQNQPSLSVNQDGRPQSNLGTAFISSRKLHSFSVGCSLHVVITSLWSLPPPQQIWEPSYVRAQEQTEENQRRVRRGREVLLAAGSRGGVIHVLAVPDVPRWKLSCPQYPVTASSGAQGNEVPCIRAL